MNIKNKLAEFLYNSPLEISINMKLRYAPVVARLKKLRMQNKNLKVLEVGSGSKGVTRFFKYPVVGMDIEFQKYKNRHLKEITSSATQRFPFKDNEFDVVIAVDAIEHIPENKRLKSLQEMIRVSKKYIMITCPCKLTKWDKRVMEKWPKNSATYLNVKEHIDCGIPDGKKIEDAFRGCRIEREYGMHSFPEYYIKLMERNIIGKVFARTVLKIFLPLFAAMKGDSRRCYFIEKPSNRK